MERYWHATTPENLESILSDGKIKADAFGEVFFCKAPLDACKFLVIRGVRSCGVIGVMLDESKLVESFDHSESFFGCKAYIHLGDVILDGDEEITGYDFDFSKS